MSLPTTSLYAGVLGILMILLAMRVSGARVKYKSSIGLDSSPELFEAIRRHGNFIEWVPFALVLMALCESNGLPKIYLHAAGISLVVARVLHPFGLKHDVMPHPFRAIGSGVTMLVVFILAVVSIWQWVVV